MAVRRRQFAKNILFIWIITQYTFCDICQSKSLSQEESTHNSIDNHRDIGQSQSLQQSL